MVQVLHLSCIHSGGTTSFLHICSYSALDVFLKAIWAEDVRENAWVDFRESWANGCCWFRGITSQQAKEYDENLTDSVGVQVENNMSSHSNF